MAKKLKKVSKTKSVSKSKSKKEKKVTKKRKEDLVLTSDFSNIDAIDQGEKEDFFASDYLLSWHAPEFVYHPKSLLWHILVGSFILLLIAISIITGQLLASIVFIISGILIFMYAEVKPKIIEIALTNMGIKVGNNFYPFNKIKSFWLVYESPVKTLNLETTRRFSPIITLQLEDTDPFLVRNILREHILEEHERSEDLFDKISRFLRF